MKHRYKLLTLAIALAAVPLHAKPAGSHFRGMAVGKDNLIRVLWWYYNNLDQYSVQVQTVDSWGNNIALGAKGATYTNWWPSDIAVGPNNDTVVAWNHQVPLPSRFGFGPIDNLSIYHVNSADNYTGSTIVSPFGSAGTVASYGMVGLDTNDYVYFQQQLSNPQFPEWGQLGARGFLSSSGVAGPHFDIQGSSETWICTAVRHDNHILVLQVLPGGNTFIQYNNSNGALSPVVLLSRLAGTNSFGRTWTPIGMTNTPDNWTQVYFYTQHPTASGAQDDVWIWDISPNGATVRKSPVFSYAGWGFWLTPTACAYDGGDGNIRIAWYQVPITIEAQSATIHTYRRSDWALVAFTPLL